MRSIPCARQLARPLAAALITVFPVSAWSQVTPAVADAVFITLGTGGGPVIRKERSEPANAVVAGGSVYLFDVGDGTQRRMAEAGLPLEKVRAVFVSHHHIDHMADLGPLLGTRWVLNARRPLPVIGPPGTVAMIADIARASGPVALAPVTIGGPAKPPLATTIAATDLAPEMDAPTIVYQDENIRVLAVTNGHYNYPRGSQEAKFSRSYAYRIETKGKTYVYTGDTGPSKNVERLAAGADILISEVIDMSGLLEALERAQVPPDVLPAMIAHMEQDHLTPVQVGALAASAGVKAVVLTHLVPGNDGETDLSPYTRGLADMFKGKVRIARDLDRF